MEFGIQNASIFRAIISDNTIEKILGLFGMCFELKNWLIHTSTHSR